MMSGAPRPFRGTPSSNGSTSSATAPPFRVAGNLGKCAVVDRDFEPLRVGGLRRKLAHYLGGTGDDRVQREYRAEACDIAERGNRSDVVVQEVEREHDDDCVKQCVQ